MTSRTLQAIAGSLFLAAAVSASHIPSAPPRLLSETGLYTDRGTTAIDPRNRPFSPQYPHDRTAFCAAMDVDDSGNQLGVTISVTRDGGRTWAAHRATGLGLGRPFFPWQLLVSANYATDHHLYLHTSDGLYRSS